MCCKFCNCTINHLHDYFNFEDETCCCEFCKEKEGKEFSELKIENVICSKCGFEFKDGHIVYTDGECLFCENCFDEFRDEYYDEVEAELDRKEYEYLCWYHDVGRHL